MTEMLSATAARNFVGGDWSESASGETYEKHNPWRPVRGHRRLRRVDGRGRAARPSTPRARRSPAWAGLPRRRARRSSSRRRTRSRRRVEQIAQDMTAEMGKPLREARMEAARAAAILRYSAGEAFRPAGEVFEPSVANQTLYTRRRPLGVVGLITPWNFPIAIPVWKLAPALIYGNTVVLKLGYEAPRTGLHIAECFAEAGLPAGVLNVLTGAGSKVGAELVANRGRARDLVHRLGAGRPRVRDEATARNCRVQLELGGHNPFIVMADAELDRAAEAAFAGAFWSAGQKCTATRRILVQDVRLRRVPREAARADRRGQGRRSVRSRDRGRAGRRARAVRGHPRGDRARARRRAARSPPAARRGDDDAYLIAPTVFENVADDAFLSCEEVFGPVTSLYRFSTLDEALERANAVEFGLSAAIFTRDLHATQRFANELQAGILHVNSQTAGADVHVPFGGLKGSAWGPHEQGRAAMEFYTETVTVYQDAPLG